MKNTTKIETWTQKAKNIKKKKRNIDDEDENEGNIDDKFIGLSVRLAEEDFEKIMIEKNRLQKHPSLGHIYVKKRSS